MSCTPEQRAPLSSDSHSATLFLLELIAAARNELSTATDDDQRITILREFVEAAMPETSVAGSYMFRELLSVLSAAVFPGAER